MSSIVTPQSYVKFEVFVSKLKSEVDLNRALVNDHGKYVGCGERPLDDVIKDIKAIGWLHSNSKVDATHHFQPTIPRVKERIEALQGTCSYQMKAWFLSTLGLSTFEDKALQKVKTLENLKQQSLERNQPSPPKTPKPKVPLISDFKISPEHIEFRDVDYDPTVTLFSGQGHFITRLPVSLGRLKVGDAILFGGSVSERTHMVRLKYWAKIKMVQLGYKFFEEPMEGNFMVLPTDQLVLLDGRDIVMSHDFDNQK